MQSNMQLYMLITCAICKTIRELIFKKNMQNLQYIYAIYAKYGIENSIGKKCTPYFCWGHCTLPKVERSKGDSRNPGVAVSEAGRPKEMAWQIGLPSCRFIMRCTDRTQHMERAWAGAIKVSQSYSQCGNGRLILLQRLIWVSGPLDPPAACRHIHRSAILTVRLGRLSQESPPTPVGAGE